MCPYCEGTGEETVRTGHMTARRTCSYCNGSRIFIKFKCLECEGLGRKTYEAPVRLNVPPGQVIDTDQTRPGQPAKIESPNKLTPRCLHEMLR